MVIKNNKGWVKIVEASIALMLIAGILASVMIERTSVVKEEVSSVVFSKQNSILREIQLNNSLRAEILDATNLPVNWENFSSSGLVNVKNAINIHTQDYLICQAKLCEVKEICALDNPELNKDLFVQNILISSNLDKYNPRQLKLFCSVKK